MPPTASWPRKPASIPRRLRRYAKTLRGPPSPPAWRPRPTPRTLERLAQHHSFDAIRADALAHEIIPVTPWVEERDGERFITIPGNLGYPVTQERLDGVWRG